MTETINDEQLSTPPRTIDSESLEVRKGGLPPLAQTVIQALSEDSNNHPEAGPSDLDFAQARLAYSIIESLLDHTRVVSDLIALMAQTLDEDTTRALTQTPVWTAYLDSRRSLERTRTDVEKFAEAMKQMDQSDEL